MGRHLWVLEEALVPDGPSLELLSVLPFLSVVSTSSVLSSSGIHPALLAYLCQLKGEQQQQQQVYRLWNTNHNKLLRSKIVHFTWNLPTEYTRRQMTKRHADSCYLLYTPPLVLSGVTCTLFVNVFESHFIFCCILPSIHSPGGLIWAGCSTRLVTPKRSTPSRVMFDDLHEERGGGGGGQLTK